MTAQNTQMALIQTPNKEKEKGKINDDLIRVLRERITSEIVIVLTGPICSGLSTISEKLDSNLKHYHYETKKIKVSEIISRFSKQYSIPVDSTSAFTRIRSLQKLGNEIRKNHKPYALSNLVVLEITKARDEHTEQNSLESDEKHNLRMAYIVDSLKNPQEIILLRQIYGNSLFVVGVDCPYDDARKRAKNEKNIESKEFDEVASIDRDESDITYGQHTLKAIMEADYFIRNDENSNRTSLEDQIKRFLDLVTSAKIITPNSHETSMYMAYAASARSACLSRQVGAIIVDEFGSVISTGCNDVPVFGGGVYNSDSKKDLRCFNKGKCYNDHHKKIIYDEISTALINANLIDKKAKEEIIKVLTKSKIKQLIEFSRAVHAEMNAIVNVSRNKNASTSNARMYCTTFPCHSCARHIVAAGIMEVIYIEPYAKSLATELHDDSITTNSNDLNKVRFIPYQGVSPSRYLNFFEMKSERKNKDGKLNQIDVKNSYRKDSLRLDDFLENEKKVIKESENLIKIFTENQN